MHIYIDGVLLASEEKLLDIIRFLRQGTTDEA